MKILRAFQKDRQKSPGYPIENNGDKLLIGIIIQLFMISGFYMLFVLFLLWRGATKCYFCVNNNKGDE